MKIIENNSSVQLRQKLYIILVNISLILLFYSIWEIKWVNIDLNDLLGLTTKLTIVYWVGLALITICSILVYSDKELTNNWIFISVLIVLGLFIIGLGVFVEENARISTSYYPPGEVKKVLSDGHINITDPYPLISYRSWPGIHLISTYMLYLTSIDIDVLIKYMTLAWLIFFVFITFSMGKSFDLSLNKCFLLSFLAISSFWTSHHYWSPQSFAFLIYLFIFLFTATINDGTVKKCISVVMFSFLVMTHLLTTVGTLLSVFMTLIYKRYERMKISKEFILFCVVFIAWHIYVAPTVIKWGVPNTLDRIVNMESASIASSKLHPNSLTELLSKGFQFAYILMYTLPVGLFLYYFRKKDHKQKMILNSIICWIVGLVFIAATVYGTEIFERLYLYSSIPLICFAIILFKDHKWSNKIFVGMMIVSVVMIIPAHYGNEVRSVTHTTELKGTEFFSKMIQPQKPYYDSYLYLFSFYIWYYNPDLISAQHNSFGIPIDNSSIVRTRYIINSRQTDNVLMFEFGYNPIQEWLTRKDNKIDLLYNNGEFGIYKNPLI